MDVHCFCNQGDVNVNTVRGYHVPPIVAMGMKHLANAT